MKNSIAERIADFLKQFPPFNLLSRIDILALASETKIVYLEKDETLYAQAKEPHQFFYIVNQGAMRLFRNDEAETVEIDICDEGDVFGLKALIGNENYATNAKAYEESIVYGLPIEVFKEQFENNTEISKYLITRFASNNFNRFSSEENDQIFSDYKRTTQTDYFSTQIKNIIVDVPTCKQDSTIQSAAKLMSAEKSRQIIIVDDENRPAGIITQNNIIENVATGKVLIMDRVTKIMSTPVVTALPELSLANAQVKMLQYKINNLCITSDGTQNTPLLGTVSQQDIMGTLSINPAVLIKQVSRSKSIKTLRIIRQKLTGLLKRYMEQKISFTYTINVVAEVNEEICKKAIELSIQDFDKEIPVAFSFFTMGSQSRKEQLTPTDQDNGIVFDNVEDSDLETTRNIFIELASVINKNLHSIGYEYCPAEMMASNPKWCLSKEEWKKQFKDWILTPSEENILLTSIFFDFKHLYGEKTLINELSQTIHKRINNNSRFFLFLVNSALQTPSPIGFFRQFLVEHNGDHKDHFNIKHKAILPLIDAARILTLSHHIKGINNTAERFYKLRELEPQNAEIYESCAYAFKALLKFKTINSLQLIGEDDGKFINLESLTKEEKLKLRRCFKPIKSVQEILNVRFKGQI